jgi:hypothetical protein
MIEPQNTKWWNEPTHAELKESNAALKFRLLLALLAGSAGWVLFFWRL